MLRVTTLALVASSAAAFHVPGARPGLAGTAAAHRCTARVHQCPSMINGFFTKNEEKVVEPVLVRGVGEGRDLPSPSGINTLDTKLQAAIVLGILAAVGAGTAVLAGPVFDAVRGTPLWNLSRPTWPILGFIYLAAGIAHFTECDGFENITPPNGTWGIFYTPFSPRTNVLWTGVVEVFGGAWMLFGAGAGIAGITLPPELGPVVSDAALTLFLLTIVVTPANIYALTHGTLCARIVALPGPPAHLSASDA